MVSPEVATEKLALACICLSLFSPHAFLPVCLKSSLPLPFVPSPSLFGFDTLLFVKVEDPWTLLLPLFSTHFPVFVGPLQRARPRNGILALLLLLLPLRSEFIGEL